MTPGFQAPLLLLLLASLQLPAGTAQSTDTSSWTPSSASSSTTARGQHSSSSSTTTPRHDGGPTLTPSSASSSTTAPGHHSSSSSTTTPRHHGGPTSTPSSASSSTTTPRHHGGPTSTPSLASSSTTARRHHSSSSLTTTPGHHGGTSPTHVPPGHSASTAASTTHRGSEPPTSSNRSTSPQSLRISFFLLSFSIENRQFNSSLEDPSSSYYQELQRNISELFWQIYKKEGFLGLSNIKFRAGSVVVESNLAFRKGATDARSVQTQLEENKKEFAAYHLSISNVRAQDVSLLSSGQSGSGVPGWGIALLVLVCVLVALAIICVIALTVCQCCRKNCGQLDIFPARDAYHPMSEYPTYHTHGRYVPPGSRPSPYEEVSAGNGGSGFSYVNPSTSATSGNL
ncbi:mucin-1 [Lontra canadensis]|uniref:mucin-1 n=1 Tax=Lontra canadensis TaxID=76717 RepID=UPI0013F361B0|nr:mucin-1 [Lontra canadensis]